MCGLVFVVGCGLLAVEHKKQHVCRWMLLRGGGGGPGGGVAIYKRPQKSPQCSAVAGIWSGRRRVTSCSRPLPVDAHHAAAVVVVAGRADCLPTFCPSPTRLDPHCNRQTYNPGLGEVRKAADYGRQQQSRLPHTAQPQNCTRGGPLTTTKASCRRHDLAT